MTAPLTCPRCLLTPVPMTARFCPRCGMADVVWAAAEDSPVDVPVGSRVFRITNRFAVGSTSCLYRCNFYDGSGEVEGIAKIARDGRISSMLAAEVSTLNTLWAADVLHRYTPFLPAVEATFLLAADEPARTGANFSPPALPRAGTILRLHPEIRSPSRELYSLQEVRRAYSAGLDQRHVAWIWRRVLSVLGFVHRQNVIHGAVLPVHLLIDPRDHKLLLIDWTTAVSADGRTPVRLMNPGYGDWYKREYVARHPPAIGLDLALAARSMIELMAGDPVTGALPPAVDPAVARHLTRCLSPGPGARPDAWRLLDDFDKLIQVLWGPRQFVPLAMPPK